MPDTHATKHTINHIQVDLANCFNKLLNLYVYFK